LKRIIPSRIVSWCIIIFFTVTAKSQNLDDYFKMLTSGLKQSWRLDSVTLNSTYGLFRKGTVLLFKLSNEIIVSDNSSHKKETITWLLSKKDKYALLNLGDAGYFEIDFLMKNNTEYMRLRNEIRAQKNMDVTEYYFVKSN
jgi:hypothetical protein